MAEYTLDTLWQVAAEPETIWPALTAVEDWPAWWRGVVAVERLSDGEADGLGRRYRTTWRGRLPYSLSFEVETTRLLRPVLIEGRASGQLRGVGVWRLEPENAYTWVYYRWAVRTTQPWMNTLAPLARPVFRWNHDCIMRWGAAGLSRRLGVAVRCVADRSALNAGDAASS